MKRNKPLGILILLLLFGCSKFNDPTLLISRFESKVQKNRVVERKLAGLEGNKCFKDTYNLSTVKAEVQVLEKNYVSGMPVKGKWRHLDLERLPIPQANFLKDFGDKIGDLSDPESIDYRECNDVPCIFNKIYGKGDDVAGYVHYLWYLKFGQMLSADNNVPRLQGQKNPQKAGFYNGQAQPFANYLYDEKELYGFWRISHMLKSPYASLAKLREIQRLPRKQAFEHPIGSITCGLSFSGGWIQLKDDCLSISKTNIDQGSFYISLTHEMAHQIDYQEGNRSEKADYLEISGFITKEYTDDEGKKHYQWAHKEGSKFISNYAETEPAENFAETLAKFRIDGDSVSLISKEHAEFTSKNYYDQLYYNQESVVKRWLDERSPIISQAALKSLMDCGQESQTAVSKFFVPQDFNHEVLPKQLNCFGYHAENLSRDLKASVYASDPEGCSLKGYVLAEKRWAENLKEKILENLERYRSELKQDPSYLAKVQSFYDQVSDKKIAREAFIGCVENEDERACYEREIRGSLVLKAKNLNLTAEDGQDLTELYLSSHSYDDIQTETHFLYRTLVSSLLEVVRMGSAELWRNCVDRNQNDDETPVGKHFKINDEYLVSSLYNCLNASFDQTVKDISLEVSIDSQTAATGKELLLIKQEVAPKLESFILEKYHRAQEEENQIISKIIQDDQGRIRQNLLSEMSWMSNPLDEAAIGRDCFKKSLNEIDFLPLYHLKKDSFGAYIEKNVCVGMATSKEFSVYLDNSKVKVMNSTYQDLESEVSKLGEAKARSCIGKYPVDTNVSRLKYKKEREACLTESWEGFEDKVLEPLTKDPMIQRYQISVNDFKNQLVASRRRLQIKIMKDIFLI